MAEEAKTDFLRFSAYSFKDLITRKLAADTKFTDSVYEGSNLAVLIDLCAYLFQGLQYSLNNAASEAMFADTQIFSNIVRLSQLLGYSVKGMTPPVATFCFDSPDQRFYNQKLLEFTAIDAGKSDADGRKVYYSVCDTVTVGSDEVVEFQAYNGQWKLYDTINVASGGSYETFTLDGLKSSEDEGKYVAHKQIRVYVRRWNSDSSDYDMLLFRPSDAELFATTAQADSTVKIYDKGSRIFNVRLNEDRTYEIKFGNGITGARLEKGDQLYVFYLDANGDGAELAPGDVKDAPLLHSAEFLGISREMYDKMFAAAVAGRETSDGQPMTLDTMPLYYGDGEAQPARVSNNGVSTERIPEETVDQVRENAPNWFKLGRRLISASDYVYYIKNVYPAQVIDVLCQNNWEYVTTFYKWLYKLGVREHGNGRYYINEARCVKYGFEYSDPADSNNVYLWVKARDNKLAKTVGEGIKTDLANLKSLTANPVFLNAIHVYFAICAAPDAVARGYLESGSTFDSGGESYIEVTVDNNSIYNKSVIQSQVAQIFDDYFVESKHLLGEKMDLNQILDQVYALDGVQRVRTVYVPAGGSEADARAVNGICFATWSGDFIDTGDDMAVSTISPSLEPFQFPKLYNTDVASLVKVIRPSIKSINQIQY